MDYTFNILHKGNNFTCQDDIFSQSFLDIQHRQFYKTQIKKQCLSALGKAWRIQLVEKQA